MQLCAVGAGDLHAGIRDLPRINDRCGIKIQHLCDLIRKIRLLRERFLTAQESVRDAACIGTAGKAAVIIGFAVLLVISVFNSSVVKKEEN